MLTGRHDVLNIDDGTVPSIAADVRDKIPRIVETCIDAIGALAAVSFDVADQRAGPVVSAARRGIIFAITPRLRVGRRGGWRR